jgi:putative transposase
MIKSFKYRLFTSSSQETALDGALDAARFLYNNALEQRIICWKQWHKSISYYDQSNALKEIRSFDEEIARLNFSASQDVLRRLDKAFQAFFRRLKQGDTPGFPRFKGKDRFDSITFPTYGDGVKLKNGKLYIQNIGNVRIKLHRDIEGTIKTVTLRRTNDKWYACFSCEVTNATPLPITNSVVGVDVGCSSFATLSTGEKIANPRFLKTDEAKLLKSQRRLSKAVKGSPDRKKQRRKLSRIHEKIANRRDDFAHKLSLSLILAYQIIVFEKLNIIGMMGNKTKYFGHKLNKSISDAAWRQFMQFTIYKAACAGRQVIFVNPRNTSKICSRCGRIVEKTLADRVHRCSCGLVLDRDENAAINILSLGLKTLGLAPGSRLL